MDKLFEPPRGPLSRSAVTAAGLVLGVFVAVVLGWFMFVLIEGSEMRLDDTGRSHLLDFVRLKREEVVQKKERRPERPEVNKKPDMPQNRDNRSDTGDHITVNLGDVGLDVGGLSGYGIGSNSNYLPIVLVAPVYPRRGLVQGIEGECLVRYTVTTAGTIKDVVAIEDQCTDRMFIRPSIDAAYRFRYKPKVIDGEAIEVRNVYNMFYFELDDEEDE